MDEQDRVENKAGKMVNAFLKNLRADFGDAGTRIISSRDVTPGERREYEEDRNG